MISSLTDIIFITVAQKPQKSKKSVKPAQRKKTTLKSKLW